MSARAVRTGLAALVSCLALVLPGCASSGGVDVVVTPAATGTLDVVPGGRAPVVAVSETLVTVPRHGTVIALSVTPGQAVQAGQLVGAVRELGTPTEQQSLAAELEGLQTLLDSQRAVLGRSAPPVVQTLARIAAVRQQLAEVTGQPAVLTAPQTGVVAELDVSVGSPVDSATPLMRVVDPSRVQVTVAIPGEYRSVVHVGDPGTLVVPGSGGRQVPATVTAVVPSARSAGGFQVTAAAANADAALTIGTTAYLALRQRLPDVLRVPTRAVLGTTAKPYVYVVDGGRAALTPVVTGPSDGTWTQVLTGVQAGQAVVLTGNQQLTDRTPVHVTDEQAPA